MKKFPSILSILLFMSAMVNARDFYCSGKIMDSVTHEGVPGTIAYIMNQDSVVLDSMYSTRDVSIPILGQYKIRQ